MHRGQAEAETLGLDQLAHAALARHVARLSSLAVDMLECMLLTGRTALRRRLVPAVFAADHAFTTLVTHVAGEVRKHVCDSVAARREHTGTTRDGSGHPPAGRRTHIPSIRRRGQGEVAAGAGHFRRCCASDGGPFAAG